MYASTDRTIRTALFSLDAFAVKDTSIKAKQRVKFITHYLSPFRKRAASQRSSERGRPRFCIFIVITISPCLLRSTYCTVRLYPTYRRPNEWTKTIAGGDSGRGLLRVADSH